MNSNLEKYLELLSEIKGRIIVIEKLQFNGKKRINDVHVEFACLQIRKILESIAFGSLISNMELYSKEYDKFSKFWNAELMLKDMERINKNFYPKPLLQVNSEIEGVIHDLIHVDEINYLNSKLFIKIYKKCGIILHTQNPYGTIIDYEYYRKNILVWLEKIKMLMNCHEMQLVGDENLYLFQIGSKEQAPFCTEFNFVKKF